MSLTTITTAEEKISKAIIALQRPQPFFAYLVMKMRPKVMPKNSPMPTVGVDANGTLYYDRDWVMAQGDEEMVGLLAHECLHVALLHALRNGGRDVELANIAKDAVVNMMVAQSNMKLPSGGIPVDISRNSSQFNVEGVQITINNVSEKTWEEAYAEIIEQLQKKGKAGQSGGGLPRRWDNHFPGDGSGDGKDGEEGGSGKDEPLSAQEMRDIERDWQTALAEAANYAKQQGKLPNGMQRIVDKLLKPKVQWKQLLRRYVRPFLSPVDWSYQRPHRKSQVLEVYLPHIVKEQILIEVIVDTSGSIGKDELTEFLSEIVAISRSHNHVQMWVTFVDAAVQGRYKIDNGDVAKIMAMEAKGGGGTSMETGLDYVKKNSRDVPLVIVMTDGCDTFNRKAKDYPFEVLWVINKRGISKEAMQKQIPYGIKIKMDG